MTKTLLEIIGSAVAPKQPGRRRSGNSNNDINPIIAAENQTAPIPASAPTPGAEKWSSRSEVFFSATEPYPELPAALYKCASTPDHGPVLVRQRVSTDTLLELPDHATTQIVGEFESFWKLGDQFRARGFLHKRGFLLWGPPGSGKTTTIHLLINRLIRDHNGCVIQVENASLTAACLQLVRRLEPHRPVIALLEDIDALVDDGDENDFLSLLDGESQVDNIVFVATTNYPERLDKRFLDRPSRFDTIAYIGMPNAAGRRIFLETKEPSLKGDELNMWVKKSDGLAIAHLKELIIAVKCLNQPFDEVVKRLQDMHKSTPKSTDFPGKSSVGFGV